MELKMIAGLIVAGLISGGVQAEDRTGTVPVNGLDMYYEIHGGGEPLVLLHGGWMNIEANWAAMIPVLAETRQVIALEAQGHGRTNDRDTPITYEGMADDVAVAMEALGVEKAAIFGYSMGAGSALQLAIRHPEKVDCLIIASGSYSSKGLSAGFEDMIKQMTPEMFLGSPMETEYKRLSPHPEKFIAFSEKMIALEEPLDWPEADVRSVAVPTLVIAGDADVMTLEHTASLYRLFGGTENGDINGLSDSQLLVLPGSSHVGVFSNPLNIEIMRLAVPAFLAAELPPKPPQF